MKAAQRARRAEQVVENGADVVSALLRLF